MRYLPCTFLLVIITVCILHAEDSSEAKHKYFAIGDGIKKPGVYPLRFETGITVAEAMALGGGASDGSGVNSLLADLRRVYVLRIINGKQHDFTVDARKAGKDREFLIIPGDIVIVPWFM